MLKSGCIAHLLRICTDYLARTTGFHHEYWTRERGASRDPASSEKEEEQKQKQKKGDERDAISCSHSLQRRKEETRLDRLNWS